MKRSLCVVALALGVLAAGGCVSAPPIAGSPEAHASSREAIAAGPVDPSRGDAELTILVSIDGFRADYLDRGDTPTLKALADQGARASMRPAFPSITFPNHYTLVTGKHPDKHGVIYNRMEDPQKPGVVFTLGNREVASDPLWWADAVPLWVTAERGGLSTATMFWPGSDYELSGGRPDKWRSYDQTLPDFARVDQLLAWLGARDAGATERPRFATLYFDIVDTAGHRYGPDSPDTRAAAAQVDAAIARLLAGLDARGLRRSTNLVIVSDHGMAQIADDRVMLIDDLASPDIARVVWDGPFAGIAPQPGKEEQAEAALVGRKRNGECWRKADAPARFRYGSHRRVPPIVCLADMGWRYRSSTIRAYEGPNNGAHGYDPAAPEMAALFIANGPRIKAGVTLPSFDSVSVYPLLAQLIGVAAEPNDGKLSDTAPALR